MKTLQEKRREEALMPIAQTLIEHGVPNMEPVTGGFPFIWEENEERGHYSEAVNERGDKITYGGIEEANIAYFDVRELVDTSNFSAALRLFRDINEKEWSITLVDDGAQTPEIKRLAERCGLDPRSGGHKVLSDKQVIDALGEIAKFLS